jgi:hypothetical protein
MVPLATSSDAPPLHKQTDMYKQVQVCESIISIQYYFTPVYRAILRYALMHLQCGARTLQKSSARVQASH